MRTLRLAGVALGLFASLSPALAQGEEPSVGDPVAEEPVHPPGVETNGAWYAFSAEFARRLRDEGRVHEAVEEYFACGALRLDEVDMLADGAVLLVDNAHRLPGGLSQGSESYRIVEDLLRAAVPRGGVGDKRLAYAIGRLRFADLNWARSWEMLKEAYADGEGHDPERTRRWFFRATINRSDLLIRAHRMDEAIAELSEVIEESPEDADWLLAAKLNLAAAHRRHQQRIESERILLELTGEYPDDPQPYNSLGQVYFDQGRLEESLEAYEKSISLAAAAGRPYSDMVISVARVLHKLGELDESEKRVTQFLERDRDSSTGLYLLAQLQRDKGDTMEAVRTLRRARRFAPDDHTILTLLQQIHYERDEIALAEEIEDDLDELVEESERRLRGDGDESDGDGESPENDASDSDTDMTD